MESFSLLRIPADPLTGLLSLSPVGLYTVLFILLFISTVRFLIMEDLSKIRHKIKYTTLWIFV